MRYEFKLPDIGEGIAEAEIVAWHVKVGDTIGEDQQIADMMTDKATVEMESPVAGKVIELAGEVGDQIPIGSVLAVIETEGANRAAEPVADSVDERPLGGGAAPRKDATIKVVGLRRKIDENMQEAKRRIPHFTLVEEYDVTDLEDTRAMMNRDRGSNPKLTLLPFLITAMARALPEWPMLNATYDDDANVITRHGSLNLGMATQTDNGLMVAVIRDAQKKNVWQLAADIVRLADAARSGK